MDASSIISTIIIGIITIFLTIHYNRKLLKRDEISFNRDKERHFEYVMKDKINEFLNKYKYFSDLKDLCKIADILINNYGFIFEKSIYSEFNSLPKDVKKYLTDEISYIKDINLDKIWVYINQKYEGLVSENNINLTLKDNRKVPIEGYDNNIKDKFLDYFKYDVEKSYRLSGQPHPVGQHYYLYIDFLYNIRGRKYLEDLMNKEFIDNAEDYYLLFIKECLIELNMI